MLERPIFVVGTMRSGSTLFRLVLDAHPNISIGEETGFMGALAAMKQIPNWQHGRGWYERIGWSEEEFDERLRQFWSELFERRALARGKQRWGDKTPFHSEHMARMAAVFPDAVFVAIVRHPGAVVHSLVRKFHYGVSDAADYWTETNKEILRRGLELGEKRFALVRYEDLVTQPEPVLRELVEWLDEPWSDDLLRHNQVQAAQGAPRISAGQTRTRDPINAQLADKWVDGLSETHRGLMAERVGEVAAFFGYDPGRPGVRGPLVDPDSPGLYRVLTGDALLARQSGPGAIALDRTEECVAVPEMDATELAKRLQQAEAALARARTRRAVRWTNELRRLSRRLTGLPAELRGGVRRPRRHGPAAAEEPSLHR